MSTSAPILEVQALSKHFALRGGFFRQVFRPADAPIVRALDGVDFTLAPGEVLGVVGESGCGKSTLGFTVVGLHAPSSGAIRFRGATVDLASARALKAFRREAQIVFQDPYQSLNPRFTVADTVGEPLAIHGLAHGGAARERVLDTLDQVGLRPAHAYLARYPHELSGGQRQRVAIARAMVLQPRLLVADEPVSMLDVSIRAGVLKLLRRLADQSGLAIVYISHDISTVRYLADRTAVMYLGRLVESGPTDAVLSDPRHPYTQALLAAVPRMRADRSRMRVRLPGEPPRAIDRPPGCAFHPRCPRALPVCATAEPPLRTLVGGHAVACVHYNDPQR